jgi:hypothetical protein
MVRATLVAVLLVVALGFVGDPASAAVCNEDVPGASQCTPAPDPALEQPEDKSYAVSIYDYAMGTTNGGCFSCVFVQEFLLAISSFSVALFGYFAQWFAVLMPLIFALWLAAETVKFFWSGGENGQGFAMKFGARGGLFVLMWLVLFQGATPNTTQVATPVNAQAPWTWFGPEALRFGFSASADARSEAVGSLTVGGASVREKIGFNCRGIARGNTTLEANPGPLAYIYYAAEMACSVERSHFVPIAGGFAMMDSAFSSVEGRLNAFKMVLDLFGAMIIATFAVLLMVMAALSMIWMVFLILDVVVKFMVIAAIMPVLIGMAFLAWGRKYFFNAVRQLVGGLATLLGISIATAISFYLLANTVAVYNSNFLAYDAALEVIPTADLFSDLRELVRRLALHSSDPQRIPMTMGTPWFWYLLLVCASNLVLSKKIISVFENITGARGLTEMADMAKRTAAVGGLMAAGAGFFGLKAAGSASVGAAKATGWAGSKVWSGFRGTKDGEGKNPAASLNPFGAAAHAVRTSFSAGRKASAATGQALNAVADNPPPQ